MMIAHTVEPFYSRTREWYRLGGEDVCAAEVSRAARAAIADYAERYADADGPTASIALPDGAGALDVSGMTRGTLAVFPRYLTADGYPMGGDETRTKRALGGILYVQDVLGTVANLPVLGTLIARAAWLQRAA